MAFFTQEVEAAKSSAVGVKAAHGLTVGQAIRANGADFVLAQANAVANCGTFLGCITAVLDANSFEYGLPGALIGNPGDYTAGATYYLSEMIAGELTTVPPTSVGINLPVGQATPTGQLILGAYVGFEDTAATGGIFDLTSYQVLGTAHGFTVGNALRSTTTGYALAQANNNTNSNAYVGVVVEVVNANLFKIGLPGTRYGTGFTGGAVYYLSAATPGALTTTQPTTPNYVIPVGVGLPTGELLLGQYIGVQA